ncbi:hypothetical protein QE370_001558 [Aeromicrobium sp. SORGH_AS981]|nr:hypothetical protein [Aeromicrobium sp. SORGH_AS_0981]MDR6118374.1 hypothetical protein [Aeromicrobium sp. SORGH_AS_0981]
MHEVLVEGVVGRPGQVALDPHELLRRTLVADEEQTGRQLAETVRAVDEVVAASQDPGAAVVVGVCLGDVRRDGDERLAVRATLAEVDRRVLVAAGQRTARALGPADDRLLPGERLAVPRLDAHVDAARDQVGAADHPVGTVALLDPHHVVHVAVLGLHVRGAVLEAEQVARRGLGRRRRRRATEAELGVAHRRTPEGDADEVADRVHGHLGVVRARLDRDVAARQRRLETVAGEQRQVGEVGGPRVAEAEPGATVALEQARPEADGQRQARRGQAEGLAGVLRWRLRGARDSTVDAHLVALGELARRLRPLLQEADELVAALGRHVEHDEVQPVLRRGEDARLVPTLERDRDRLGVGAHRLVARRADRVAAGDARSHGTGAGRAEQGATREGRALAHAEAATTAATLLVGSLSAATESESRLTCSLLSVS